MSFHPVSDPPEPFSTPDHPYSRPVVWSLVAAGSVIFVLWLLGTPPGLLGKADAVGYAICHRIAQRSFHADGRQLPLCARCTGIYLGVMLDLLVFGARGRLRASKLPPLKVLALFMLFGAAFGIDGLNSYLSLFAAYKPVYQPNNTLRLLTGMGFGLSLMGVVLPVFNSIIWQTPEPVAPLRDLKESAVLVGSAILVSVAVLAKLAAVLVAAGLISTAGVVLMFGIVGGTVFLTVTRRENSLMRWRDLAVPALAGLVFAISVIGTIDLARHLFTGTWAGFSLPG